MLRRGQAAEEKEEHDFEQHLSLAPHQKEDLVWDEDDHSEGQGLVSAAELSWVQVAPRIGAFTRALPKIWPTELLPEETRGFWFEACM